jgi:flagellar hook-length control protein FliK
MADAGAGSTRTTTAARAPKVAMRPGTQMRPSAIDAVNPAAATFNDVLATQMEPAATAPDRGTAPLRKTDRMQRGAKAEPGAPEASNGAAGAEAVASAQSQAAATDPVATASAGAEAVAAALAAQQALTRPAPSADGAGARLPDESEAEAAIEDVLTGGKGKRGGRGADGAAQAIAEGVVAAAPRAGNASAHAAGLKRTHAGETSPVPRGVGAEASSTHGRAEAAREDRTGRDRSELLTAVPDGAAVPAAPGTIAGTAAAGFAERLREATQPVAPPSTDAASTLPAVVGALPGASETRAPEAGTPVYTVATHVSDPRWTSEIARVVSVGIGERVQEAEIRIDPAELGPIRMHVTIDGDTASVRFTVAQADTQMRLQDSLEHLRETLADAGIQLGDATVASGDARGRDDAPARDGSRRARLPGDDGVAIAVPGVAGAGGRPSGLVDTFA